MEEQQMTKQISLNLTLEELEIIDKYIELNDDTRQLFDKIRSAYPKSPVEAAYKRVYGWYPPTTPTTPSVSNYEDNRWSAFQSGYSCGYGDGLENSNDFAISKVEETAQERGDRIHKEVENEIEKLQEKNWYVDAKTLLKSKKPVEKPAKKFLDVLDDIAFPEWGTVDKPEEKQPTIIFENRGKFDVVSYHNPQNSGDEIYWRIEQPNSFSWWRRYIVPHRLDMVQNKEKEQELEQLYHKQLEREMIKRNLKTSLQELSNGDVRPIDDVVKEAKKEQESWMNKPINELVETLNKNPPDCLKFQMGKTLEQLIERWWCDVFVGPNEKWTMEECIADLCDRIHLWLPKEQSAAGSQSLGVEDMVEGFNDAIQKIKRKLR